MPTQQDVKFSDFIRGLPAATESDLAAGNNMPIVSASEIKKMGGENVAPGGSSFFRNVDLISSTSILPFGKTLNYKKSQIKGLKSSYIDQNLNVQPSQQHKHIELSILGVKSIKVSVPGGGLSSLYVVLYENDKGEIVRAAPLSVGGEIVVNVPLTYGKRLFINFFASLGDDVQVEITYHSAADVLSIIGINGNFDIAIPPTSVGFGKTANLLKSAIVGLVPGYIENNGNVKSSNTHSYLAVDAFCVKTISFSTIGSGLSGLSVLVIENEDGTFTHYGSLSTQESYIINVPSKSKRLFINFFASLGDMPLSVEYLSIDNVIMESVSKNLRNYTSLPFMPSQVAYGRKVTIDPSAVNDLVAGTIKDDGTTATGSNRFHFDIPLHGVKKVTIKNAAGGGISGYSHVVVSFPNGENRSYCHCSDAGNLSTDEMKRDWVGTIHINYYPATTSINATWEIEYYSEQELQTFEEQKKILVNLVQKPLNISSSDKVLFAGSSVMRGFVNGSTITDYNFPYWMNEQFNFSYYRNVAVGGSTIAEVSGLTKLVNQLSVLDESYSLIVLYAGQNDYAMGVDLDVFRSAVVELCQYINEHASNSARVIFITPLNDGGYHMYDKARYTGSEEDCYRIIIQEEFMKNDTYGRFSVVHGKFFGFPTMTSSAASISTFFGDKLHPTELGYKTLFFKGFLNAIM